MVVEMKSNPKYGDVTYTKKRCWKAKDMPATFCDFSVDSATGHMWSLTVKIPDGQMKVESAAMGR